MAIFYVDSLDAESIVIRINKAASGVLDRKREMKYHQLLHDYGLNEHFIAVFKNGIIMRYLSGEALTHRGNLTHKIEEKIARKFANLHSKVPVVNEYYIGESDDDHILSK